MSARLTQPNEVPILAQEEEIQEFDGVVVEALPNAMFRVEFESGRRVLAHVAGEMRMHFIRLVPGDFVRVQLGPYDGTRGRIITTSESQGGTP